MNANGAFIAKSWHELEETWDILLPNQQRHATQIAIDIGGSLAKVVIYEPDIASEAGGSLKFKFFETTKIGELVAFLREQFSRPRIRKLLKATGGGAHKFESMLAENLPVAIEKEDEMECLIRGLNFLIEEIPNEVFSYDESHRKQNPLQFENLSDNVFPYIFVNIGSGVSIIKVTGPNQFERISGTSLGGGTLWGLLCLLTPAETYDEMLQFSKQGANANVDMLVGDIYGTDYKKIGLKSSTIASTFGKVFKADPQERNFRPEDVSQSLLYAVSNNIGQIAYLNAKIHSIDRIFFGGCFIRGHPMTMNALTYAVQFWSNDTVTALFLRHEGYVGAIGAILKDFVSLDAL